MKKIQSLIWILLLCGRGAWAQTPWSAQIPIASGGNPDLFVNRTNGLVYVSTMSTGVTVTIFDAAGGLISQELVPGSDLDRGGENYGAALSADQNGFPLVCYRVNTGQNQYDLYYTRKTLSGWSAPLKIAAAVNQGMVVRMVVDEDDVTNVVWGRSLGDVWGEVTYGRIENGMFQSVQTGMTPFRYDNRMEIAAGPAGLLHLILGSPDLNGGQITYWRSFSGQNFSNRGPIQSNDNSAGRNGSPDVFADRVGNIHFVYGTTKDSQAGDEGTVRYVRYSNNAVVRSDVIAVEGAGVGDLEPGVNDGWRIASVAATDTGQIVNVIYLTKDAKAEADGGSLFVVESPDGGVNWFNPVLLGTQCGGSFGRDVPLIRAAERNFYVAYSSGGQVYLRIGTIELELLPPVAKAGGPYSSIEGDSVILDASGSFSLGENSGIVLYEWDINQDGIPDLQSTNPRIGYVFQDDLHGQITLWVKDQNGKTVPSPAQVDVANVPPRVQAGNDITCNEGDALNLGCVVTDPGKDTFRYEWQFGNGTTSSASHPSIIYTDNGTYWVYLAVQDDDGGIGRDTVRVTVRNVKPTVDAGGPYLAPRDVSITLRGTVTDPSVSDVLTYQWDLNNDGLYEAVGQNVTWTFGADGLYPVRFRAYDDDMLPSEAETDTTSVVIATLPPHILTIPNQVIDEGGSFPPLSLDSYINDPFHADNTFQWTFKGNQILTVTLNNRILSVAAPNLEWNGQETLTLVVTDVYGGKDSTAVLFRVNLIDDPPVFIRSVGDITFPEDTECAIRIDSLKARVQDPDTDPSVLRFSVSGNQMIHWTLDSINQVIRLTALPNWYGRERVAWTVRDPAGLTDNDSSWVTVTPFPDPPRPFELTGPMLISTTAWPDTIRFTWRSTTNEDMSELLYVWRLRNAEESWDMPPTADTTLTWINSGMPNGVFYWSVVAYTSGGLNRESSNIGIIQVQPSAVGSGQQLPTEFELMQNYPNPFNPETRIEYHLPKSCHVRMSVMNTLGQDIAVLVDGWKSVGIHNVVWNGLDDNGMKAPAGVYFCRFAAGDRVFNKKMLLIE